MTVESIMMLCTTLMTLLFGGLAKRFGWVEKTYLPIQNILIGILAGLLCWIIGLNENILTSILICLTSSMCAGGVYDVTQINRKIEENEGDE